MQHARSSSLSLSFKLVILNSIVIGLVIFISGYTVKEYACYVVNSGNVTGPQLNAILDHFLVQVSILAFVIAGLVHLFILKRIFAPLHKLKESIQSIQNGSLPRKIKPSKQDEIGELTESYNALIESLVDIQKNQDQMLKDLSHELRTPLTNLNGYLEGLMKGIIEGDAYLYQSLLDESKRITRLAEQVSEFNAWHAREGFNIPSFHPISAEKLIGQSLYGFELKFRSRIKTTVSVQPAMIRVHEDGIKQVISNILQNAADYDTGRWLSVKGYVKDGFYLFAFQQEGKRIPPAESEAVFDRFYRTDISRIEKTDGAGLGLAIAKEITEKHGGTIYLETDGKIHTFYIRLPLENS
ncbi:sensor histidine kinase [Metabacillus sp. 113a]|uniref:sensor histidine kinase n=1 Tax=Metabacillus sp. 113a TaxID=3404706 RepID=UPI003CF85C43